MRRECAEVLERLGESLPAELEAHVAGCEECRALVESFGALGPVGGPPQLAPAGRLSAGLEMARTRSLAELEAHPTPAAWWRELLGLLGVYAGMLVAGAVVLARSGGLWSNGASPWRVAGLAVVLLGVLAGGAVVALAPLRRPAGALVGTTAAAVALAVLLTGSGQAVGALVAGLVACTRAALVLSALPMVAALALLRRSAYHPARAVAAGLSAGTVGLLLLHVHCPDGSMTHLLLSHVMPWLLLGLVALAVRRRLRSYTHAP